MNQRGGFENGPFSKMGRSGTCDGVRCWRHWDLAASGVKLDPKDVKRCISVNLVNPISSLIHMEEGRSQDELSLRGQKNA